MSTDRWGLPWRRCLERRRLLGLHEARQTVLHFLGGLQHGALIVDEQLLEPGILDADVAGDAAVVEERQIDGTRWR